MGLFARLFHKKRSIVRNKDTGNFLVRYYKSFCHAIDGFFYAAICEHNMAIIIVATLVTTLAGLYYNISVPEWLFVIGIIGAVTASEMINTAVEATIDLVTSEKHPLAKVAKDTASAATLVLSVTALIGAILIFVPKMF